MEVILLEKMSGLGDIGSIITVKDGFARNYLIPRKKVLRATAQNKLIVEERRALLELQNVERKAAAEKQAEQIAGITISVLRQAGDDGRLYGSVTARDIVKAVDAATGIKLLDEMIIMIVKIKEIGIHTVAISLHSDVSAELFANVARNAQEAGAALTAKLNAATKAATDAKQEQAKAEAAVI